MQISLATFVQNKVIRSIMQSFFLIRVQCNSYYSGDVNISMAEISSMVQFEWSQYMFNRSLMVLEQYYLKLNSLCS